MKKYLKPLIIGALCLMALIMAAVYYITPDTLRVVTANRMTISPELMGTGRVEGDRKIVVYSDVAGVIEKRFVEVGDRVKENDTLVSYRGEGQQEQVEMAETDAEYSEKISDASKNNRENYEKKYRAAVRKIAECEKVYAVLEQNMMNLNSENHAAQSDIAQRKKNIESDISKLEEQVGERQSKLAEKEAKMKLAEMEEDEEKMDDYVDDVEDIQEEIAGLNAEISRLQRDAICLPEEGMDQETYDRYLVLQNDLDTVMRMWTEARTEKDIAEPLMNAYGEVYSGEQTAEKDKIALHQAKKELNKADRGTLAPASGVITECPVDAGAYVEKGVPIMEMQSSDAYKVRMMVSKYDISSVKIGQNADIRIGNQRYAGKVSKIQQVAENDTAGKAKASIEISIDTDEELIVGLEADVVVELEEAPDVITVPNECIYNDDGGSFVYTVEEDEVKKTYVTSGVNDSEYTEVEGLEADTHVVMDPSAAANLGEEIRESMVEDPQ